MTAILRPRPVMFHCRAALMGGDVLRFVNNSYSFYASSSKSEARAELNRARAAVLCALQATDRSVRRVTDTQIGHAIVGMVEEVRRRSANPKSIALLKSKAPINGKRDDLSAGANHTANR